MDQQRRGPASGDTESAGARDYGSPEHSATTGGAQVLRKWQRVLKGFISRGAQGWNRFEIYRELRDSCLNSTVSELELRGIKILRREEVVPGAFGPVRCNRYWLDPASIQLAHELLLGAA